MENRCFEVSIKQAVPEARAVFIASITKLDQHRNSATPQPCFRKSVIAYHCILRVLANLGTTSSCQPHLPRRLIRTGTCLDEMICRWSAHCLKYGPLKAILKRRNSCQTQDVLLIASGSRAGRPLPDPQIIIIIHRILEFHGCISSSI